MKKSITKTPSLRYEGTTADLASALEKCKESFCSTHYEDVVKLYFVQKIYNWRISNVREKVTKFEQKMEARIKSGAQNSNLASTITYMSKSATNSTNTTILNNVDAVKGVVAKSKPSKTIITTTIQGFWLKNMLEPKSSIKFHTVSANRWDTTALQVGHHLAGAELVPSLDVLKKNLNGLKNKLIVNKHQSVLNCRYIAIGQMSKLLEENKETSLMALVDAPVPVAQLWYIFCGFYGYVLFLL